MTPSSILHEVYRERILLAQTLRDSVVLAMHDGDALVFDADGEDSISDILMPTTQLVLEFVKVMKLVESNKEKYFQCPSASEAWEKSAMLVLLKGAEIFTMNTLKNAVVKHTSRFQASLQFLDPERLDAAALPKTNDDAFNTIEALTIQNIVDELMMLVPCLADLTPNKSITIAGAVGTYDTLSICVAPLLWSALKSYNAVLQAMGIVKLEPSTLVRLKDAIRDLCA